MAWFLNRDTILNDSKICFNSDESARIATSLWSILLIRKLFNKKNKQSNAWYSNNSYISIRSLKFSGIFWGKSGTGSFRIALLISIKLKGNFNVNNSKMTIPIDLIIICVLIFFIYFYNRVLRKVTIYLFWVWLWLTQFQIESSQDSCRPEYLRMF